MTLIGSMRCAGLVAVALVALQALVLYLFGQPAMCDCGYLKLWEGVVLSPGNSQHLTDWYTPSHVIHGVLFYAVLALLFPRLSLSMRFLLAVALEAGWEIVENLPQVIEHYRQQALAQGYVGDSIVNSVSDSLAMIAGFFAAQRLSVGISVVLVIALELLVLFFIRDSLALNVLGFFYVPEWLASWQLGR